MKTPGGYRIPDTNGRHRNLEIPENHSRPEKPGKHRIEEILILKMGRKQFNKILQEGNPGGI